mgnify:CR=1 FL=1
MPAGSTEIIISKKPTGTQAHTGQKCPEKRGVFLFVFGDAVEAAGEKPGRASHVFASAAVLGWGTEQKKTARLHFATGPF